MPSVGFIPSTYSCPIDFTDFVSWHPLSYLSVSSVSSVGLIASTYSCPTDFTDLHRFRHLAFFVLTNPCHPCHLWTILPPIILVPRISSLGILCPTYLCHPCHLWALFLPLILVPQISQIYTDFVTWHSLS